MIRNMTVMELRELLEAFDLFYVERKSVNLSALRPGRDAVSPPDSPDNWDEFADWDAFEDWDAFDVVLLDSGPQKIQTMKVVRELSGLGLKETKDLVEAGNQVVFAGAGSDAAAAFSALRSAGAEVVVRPSVRTGQDRLQRGGPGVAITPEAVDAPSRPSAVAHSVATILPSLDPETRGAAVELIGERLRTIAGSRPLDFAALESTARAVAKRAG